MEVDINLLSKFFSIIVQLFGGLIAILSVFMVYALQCIQQSIELVRQDLCRVFKHFKPGVEVLSFDFQLGQVDRFIRETDSQYNKDPLFNELSLQRSAIRGYQYRVKSIKGNFFNLIKLMVFLLVVALISLCLSRYIAIYSLIMWTVTISILASSIALIIKVTFFIRESLRRQVVIISEEFKG